MRSLGCNLGGEQSGHIILADYATTGDGLIAALQVLASIVETGRPASEVCRLFTPVPQYAAMCATAMWCRSTDRRCSARSPTARPGWAAAGRLVIRRSGTEPVIRVMAEGEDEELVAAVVDEICAAIRTAAAGIDDIPQAAE